MDTKEPYIKVTKDGPYLVYGIKNLAEKIILTDEKGVSIKYGDGKTFEIKGDTIALCRCGQSKNAPFCDGSHIAEEFDGTQTASFEPILKESQKWEGPNFDLMDNIKYCAFARFCDNHGQIWSLIGLGKEKSDKWAIQEAWSCPAGRLQIFTKSGEPVDEVLPKEIFTLEDSAMKISGPLWVRGGIRVESEDGKSYEVRNRQTLCRCGASNHKPFCNGAHASVKWKAQTPK